MDLNDLQVRDRNDEFPAPLPDIIQLADYFFPEVPGKDQYIIGALLPQGIFCHHGDMAGRQPLTLLVGVGIYDKVYVLSSASNSVECAGERR